MAGAEVTSAPGAAACGMGGAIAWKGEAPVELAGGAACGANGVIWGDASNPAIIDWLASESPLGAGLAFWSGVDGMDRVDRVDLSTLSAGLACWAGGLAVAGAIGDRLGAASWVAGTSG